MKNLFLIVFGAFFLSASHVILKKGQGVTISNGFECKSGAILEIKD
jgi:hypothetical protein